MARVSSTAFPAGTKVEVHPFGVQRPGEGTNGEQSKTVGKSGMVSFDVKQRPGQFVWLSADVDGEHQTVQCPVKDGSASDAEDPAERLAEVSQPAAFEDNMVHGARDTISTRRESDKKDPAPKSQGDPNAKLKHASAMSGSEALRVSASGSFVTIPDGSHADPAAHQPVVPAHTDGLTAEEREAKKEARESHKKQTGKAAAKPRKSAQAASSKSDDGQPTKKESTHDEPTEEPEKGQRTAL